MSNVGKQFEEQFKNSIRHDEVYYYRLKDSAQSFGRSSALRFSSKNPCDAFIWDAKRRMFFALELKTVAGTSISFERTKEEHGEIHFHQAEGLNQINKYDHTVCGFVVNFRKVEETYFIPIEVYNKIIEEIPKKSFNVKDLANYDVVRINAIKKRTRYTYCVEEFMRKCYEKYEV